MAYNNNNKNSGNKKNYRGPQREVKCPCGGLAKMRTKRNYPFGKKSKGVSVTFYKCPTCGRRFN